MPPNPTILVKLLGYRNDITLAKSSKGVSYYHRGWLGSLGTKIATPLSNLIDGKHQEYQSVVKTFWE